MNKLEQFLEVFFTNELVFVLLIVLLIVLVILIVYLIKLEGKQKSEIKESEEILDIFKETEILEKKDDSKKIDIMPINDEENAIISTDELIKASENLSQTLEMDTSEIIDMYEKEQEKKAIISYEELLKNAASLNISYEEPKERDASIPVIKKIEVSENTNNSSIKIDSTNKVLNYVEEEEFLKTLKKFRMDLGT